MKITIVTICMIGAGLFTSAVTINLANPPIWGFAGLVIVILGIAVLIFHE